MRPAGRSAQGATHQLTIIIVVARDEFPALHGATWSTHVLGRFVTIRVWQHTPAPGGDDSYEAALTAVQDQLALGTLTPPRRPGVATRYTVLEAVIPTERCEPYRVLPAAVGAALAYGAHFAAENGGRSLTAADLYPRAKALIQPLGPDAPERPAPAGTYPLSESQ